MEQLTVNLVQTALENYMAVVPKVLANLLVEIVIKAVVVEQ